MYSSNQPKTTQSKSHQKPLGWRVMYNSTLVALDCVMTLIACALTFLVWPGSYGYFQQNGNVAPLWLLLIVCATWVISLACCHSYERHTMGEGYALYGKLLTAGVVDFVILGMAAYLFELNMSRPFVVLVAAFSTIFTVIERWAMRRALHRNRSKGEFNYPTVVVGSPEGIRSTIKIFNDNPSVGYYPIAVCPIAAVSGYADGSDAPQHLVSVPFQAQNDDERKLRVLTLNSRLPQTAQHLKANVIFIADVMNRESETFSTLALATEAQGLELAMSASIADLGGHQLHLRDVAAMPILTARLPQFSLLTRLVKRIMDIVLATLALIVSAIPMLIVGILVKKEDGGPAFYTQTRVGLYGKPFTMIKFRSMRVDADEIRARLIKESGMENRFIFKLKDDPRITKIGKFIRKTSLDEFPQFFNVLKGDMSLVGPRPPLPEEVSRYNMLYSARLLVKPGITGPWQVSGRSDLSQQEAERLDVSYVENWSLTGDIAILFKTVGAVIHGTGSY